MESAYYATRFALVPLHDLTALVLRILAHSSSFVHAHAHHARRAHTRRRFVDRFSTNFFRYASAGLRPAAGVDTRDSATTAKLAAQMDATRDPDRAAFCYRVRW